MSAEMKVRGKKKHEVSSKAPIVTSTKSRFFTFSVRRGCLGCRHRRAEGGPGGGGGQGGRRGRGAVGGERPGQPGSKRLSAARSCRLGRLAAGVFKNKNQNVYVSGVMSPRDAKGAL